MTNLPSSDSLNATLTNNAYRCDLDDRLPQTTDDEGVTLTHGQTTSYCPNRSSFGFSFAMSVQALFSCETKFTMVT
jgi:hypothetical protein